MEKQNYMQQDTWSLTLRISDGWGRAAGKRDRMEYVYINPSMANLYHKKTLYCPVSGSDGKECGELQGLNRVLAYFKRSGPGRYFLDYLES